MADNNDDNKDTLDQLGDNAQKAVDAYAAEQRAKAQAIKNGQAPQ